CRFRELIDELFSSPGVYDWERNEMISPSLLQEAFPKGFRPIILVATSLLKKSVGKNQSLYFSVLSVPPWCFFFLAISTRRHGEHGEIRTTRGSAGKIRSYQGCLQCLPSLMPNKVQ